MNTPSLAILAKIEAKPEKIEQVKALLTSALALANEEEQTISWYAVQISDTRFAIFDTFANEQGRQVHLNGKIADALLSQADELLAMAPEIMTANILAAKT
ncbi:antibiotic biosynthesis monooxygenase [uncultured Shewanella sp.]|uniref:putative quinol monooxygenase n=1 Tax=uncultured Shewanella sp. TaxID=173975 RepID=UPI002619F79E|nr:antibiotic biosynthesis monooxygenase [uncultured Shewanella sp.]